MSVPQDIPGQPAAPAMDLITQMQVQLNTLSENLYASIGELQQAALPSSIKDEEIIHKSVQPYNATERSHMFSKEIVKRVKDLQDLANQLPPAPTQQEQMNRIRELQALRQCLAGELEQQKQVAEVKLQQAQDLYAALAFARVKHKKQLAQMDATKQEQDQHPTDTHAQQRTGPGQQGVQDEDML